MDGEAHVLGAVLKQARVGDASHEPRGGQLGRVFLRPVLGRVAGTVHRVRQLPARAWVVARTPVLLRQGHVDRAHGRGVKIRPADVRVKQTFLSVALRKPRQEQLQALGRRRGREQLRLLAVVVLFRHEPGTVSRTVNISFVDVYPPDADGPASGDLDALADRHLAVHAHLPEVVDLLGARLADQSGIEGLARDVISRPLLRLGLV